MATRQTSVSGAISAWMAFLVASVAAAWLLLYRLQHQRVFLIRFPFDREPVGAELADASLTAREWCIPTLLFLTVAIGASTISALNCRGDVCVCFGPLARIRQIWRGLGTVCRAHPWLCGTFVASCVGDFISTVSFFHFHRITDELHPAIKLMTYAFGLTVGCFLGKFTQAMLALTVCSFLPTLRRSVLTALILSYTTATIWNLSLLRGLYDSRGSARNGTSRFDYPVSAGCQPHATRDRMNSRDAGASSRASAEMRLPRVQLVLK